MAWYGVPIVTMGKAGWVGLEDEAGVLKPPVEPPNVALAERSGILGCGLVRPGCEPYEGSRCGAEG